MVEIWIRHIPPINGRLKLSFDGSRIESKRASRWVIRDPNGIIKMVECIYLSKS